LTVLGRLKPTVAADDRSLYIESDCFGKVQISHRGGRPLLEAARCWPRV